MDLNCSNTTFANGEIVSKGDDRISAIGDIDELVAVIGIVRAMRDDANLLAVQKMLMRICGGIAQSGGPLLDSMVMEDSLRLKRLSSRLSRPFNWVYPGDNQLQSFLNLARAVCRRCERSLVKARCRDVYIEYLNILSQYLFDLETV